MRTFFIFAMAMVLLAAAGCRKSTRTVPPPPSAAEPPAGPVAATPPEPVLASGLRLELDGSDVAAMWGMVTEVPVRVEWRGGEKYAVRLTVADAPAGIKMEVIPSIVAPPGRTTLRISPVIGEAPLVTFTARVEASGYGMESPAGQEITVRVIRQDGEFVPVMAGPVTLECRNVCGKVSNGRVVFYDVLREKEQGCGDAAVLPESQRIGAQTYAVSATGFGYGRTCRVAAIFEPAGSLSIVNIGGSTSRVSRGELFLTIPAAEQCWFSPDNTLALVKTGPVLRLYDVYTAAAIGDTCTVSSDMYLPLLTEGRITAGGCEWQLP